MHQYIITLIIQYFRGVWYRFRCCCFGHTINCYCRFFLLSFTGKYVSYRIVSYRIVDESSLERLATIFEIIIIVLTRANTITHSFFWSAHRIYIPTTNTKRIEYHINTTDSAGYNLSRDRHSFQTNPISFKRSIRSLSLHCRRCVYTHCPS